jgi:hypothetical protein
MKLVAALCALATALGVSAHNSAKKDDGILDGVAFLEGVATKIYDYARPASPSQEPITRHAKQAAAPASSPKVSLRAETPAAVPPPSPEAGRRAKQAAAMAQAIVAHSKQCFSANDANDESAYKRCTQDFCDSKCGFNNQDCRNFCGSHSASLFVKLGGVPRPVVDPSSLLAQAHEAAGEEESAMEELQAAQERMRRLNARIAKRVAKEGGAAGKAKLARLAAINGLADQIDHHVATVAQFKQMAETNERFR